MASIRTVSLVMLVMKRRRGLKSWPARQESEIGKMVKSLMEMTPDERFQKMADSVNVICDESKKISESVNDGNFGSTESIKEIRKSAGRIVRACDYLLSIDKEKQRRVDAMKQAAFAASLGLC